MEDYGLFGAEVLTLKRQGTNWTFKQQGGKLMVKMFQKNYDIVERDFQEVGRDFCGYFSFAFTGQNEINFIYKNNEEQVIYLAPSFRGQKPFFKMSFSEGERITFQKIISFDNNKLILLVFTENFTENRWKIYSCTKENDTWLETLIVDSGWGFDLGQGAIAVGTEGQIYLVYQKYYRGEYQLVYVISKNNIWSEPIPIFTSQEFNFNPSLAIDKEGKPHLVWLRSINSVVKVMYSSRNRVNNFWTRWQWSKEQVVSSPEICCNSPYIIVKDEYPEIYWQDSQEFNSKVFYLKIADKEKIKSIGEYKNPKAIQITLDLDKYPEIANYWEIEAGSTLYLLFLVSESSGEIYEGKIPEDLQKVGQFKTTELLEELLKERTRVGKMELINAKLQRALLNKSEENLKARSEWEAKEKELEKEIDRLKQNQKVIQNINEDLRRRLKEKEILKEKFEEEAESTLKPDIRKVYPHFPFIKKKF